MEYACERGPGNRAAFGPLRRLASWSVGEDVGRLELQPLSGSVCDFPSPPPVVPEYGRHAGSDGVDAEVVPKDAYASTPLRR
jgi:hypothetical protein